MDTVDKNIIDWKKTPNFCFSSNIILPCLLVKRKKPFFFHKQEKKIKKTNILISPSSILSFSCLSLFNFIFFLQQHNDISWEHLPHLNNTSVPILLYKGQLFEHASQRHLAVKKKKWMKKLEELVRKLTHETSRKLLIEFWCVVRFNVD